MPPQVLLLTTGEPVLVDAEDFYLLSNFKWHLGTGGYAIRGEYRGKRASGKYARTTVKMHRQILDAPDTKQVDHINGNKLDNRRSNLRLATCSQNQANKFVQSNNTSGVKGVNRFRDKWQVRIGVNGKRQFLGYFDDLDDALASYDKAAREAYGEYARINQGIAA